MKLIKTLFIATAALLTFSCSGLISTSDTTADLSIGAEIPSEYESVFRAVSAADQGNNLYLTVYISGAVEKTVEKSVSFNKTFDGFKFVLNKLPCEGKINILLEIDDAMTKGNKKLALFCGYAKDVDLKDSKDIKISIASKANIFDGEIIQSPSIYYIRNDLSNSPVKFSQVTEVYENDTLKSVTIASTSETTASYTVSKIITPGTPEAVTVGNIKTSTFKMPQGNIWYTKDLNTALNHIYINTVEYGISGTNTITGPANWPRIIIGNEAADSVMTEKYTPTTEIASTTKEYLAAHIYLNGNTISGSDSLTTLFEIGKNTFLFFYNGAFKGKTDIYIFDIQETSYKPTLLFSNIKCTAENGNCFLNMGTGNAKAIFTGGSNIGGSVAGTGTGVSASKTVYLVGATLNGTISSDITTEKKDFLNYGDCDFTSRGYPNILNGE